MFGEEWKTCGDHLTCDNVLEYRKENNCFRGCFCKGKAVRNKEGDCVPLYECDKPPGDGRNPFSDRHDTVGFSKSNSMRGEPESVGLSGRNYINEAMDMRGYAAAGTSGSNTNDSDPSTPTTTQPTVEESENRTRRDVLAANEEECGVDEEWLTCGHHMTCDRPKVGTGKCSPGCFCKLDHVRNKHGLCISAPKCADYLFLYISPKSNLDFLLSDQTNDLFLNKSRKSDLDVPLSDQTMKCPENEVYTECGGYECFQHWCNREKPPYCKDICRRGCVCKDGYIRKVRGGRCIPEEQCPKDSSITRYHPNRPSNNESCEEENKVFSKCGAHLYCQKHCQEKEFECPRHLCQSGCICKEGYVINNNVGLGGMCIPEEQCPPNSDPSTPTTTQPTVEESENRTRRDGDFDDSFHFAKKCGENEVYTKCRGNISCQADCNGDKMRPYGCPQICTEGCECIEGYLRNRRMIYFLNGPKSCVHVDECPRGPPMGTGEGWWPRMTPH